MVCGVVMVHELFLTIYTKVVSTEIEGKHLQDIFSKFAVATVSSGTISGLSGYSPFHMLLDFCGEVHVVQAAY